MSTRAALALAGSLLALFGAVACSTRRPPTSRPQAPTGEVGLYRARVVDRSGEQHRFKLWLFAAPPDRLHGEILTPTSTPVVTLDGGGDRLALTFLRDRVAFVGRADEPSLERVFGLRISLDALVALLLDGESPGGDLSVERVPPSGNGLPEVLRLRSGEAALDLELRKRQALRADPTKLGTGEPPEGMTVRPLHDLDESGLGLDSGDGG